MRILDDSQKRRLISVNVYLTVSEALELKGDLERLLAEPESTRRANVFAMGGEALTLVMVTPGKLGVAENWLPVEQELLEGDWDFPSSSLPSPSAPDEPESVPGSSERALSIVREGILALYVDGKYSGDEAMERFIAQASTGEPDVDSMVRSIMQQASKGWEHFMRLHGPRDQE